MAVIFGTRAENRIYKDILVWIFNFWIAQWQRQWHLNMIEMLKRWYPSWHLGEWLRGSESGQPAITIKLSSPDREVSINSLLSRGKWRATDSLVITRIDFRHDHYKWKHIRQSGRQPKCSSARPRFQEYVEKGQRNFHAVTISRAKPSMPFITPKTLF